MACQLIKRMMTIVATTMGPVEECRCSLLRRRTRPLNDGNGMLAVATPAALSSAWPTAQDDEVLLLAVLVRLV